MNTVVITTTAPWKATFQVVCNRATQRALRLVQATGETTFAVAEDWEEHLRALGQDFIHRDEPIPEWLWEDLAAALEIQGALTQEGSR